MRSCRIPHGQLQQQDYTRVWFDLQEVAQSPFGFLIDYSQVGEPTFIDAREHELDEQSDLRLQEFNLCTCLFFTLMAGAALMRVVTDLPLQKEQIGVYLIDYGKVL
jgi:hypothetical protein